MKKRILVIGGGLAGVTLALELKAGLGDRHDVVVVSKSDELVVWSSLVELALGLRAKEGIAQGTKLLLEEGGVRLRHADVLRVDLDKRRAVTRDAEETYDYLVFATGAKPNYRAVPGLGPRGYTQSIASIADAEQTRIAFERFLRAPGPVVVGNAQGAASTRHAHDFAIRLSRELRARGLQGVAPITYLLASHTVAGRDMADEGRARIEAEPEARDLYIATGAPIREITHDTVVLADGRRLPFAFAMLVPSFLGADLARTCTRITNAFGFVRVNSFGQTEHYPEVFAVGAAVATTEEGESAASRSDDVTDRAQIERLAKVVARNIIAQIQGADMSALPPST